MRKIILEIKVCESCFQKFFGKEVLHKEGNWQKGYTPPCAFCPNDAKYVVYLEIENIGAFTIYLPKEGAE